VFAARLTASTSIGRHFAGKPDVKPLEPGFARSFSKKRIFGDTAE
jgi:hypothetical protein